MSEAREVIGQRVGEFYRAMPFNYEQTVEEACRTVTESNVIAAVYPALHATLQAAHALSVLDVGCGTGWFVNTVAYHYRTHAVGVDLCEPALERAQAVSDRLGVGKWVQYQEADLFDLPSMSIGATNRFGVVNSLGVLHHTYDCRRALMAIGDLVEPGGGPSPGGLSHLRTAAVPRFVPTLSGSARSDRRRTPETEH